MNAKHTIRDQVMDYVEQNGPCTRTEIVKKIREIQGKPYDAKRDSGYYSAALADDTISYYYHTVCHFTDVKPGYFRRPTKNDPRYLVRKDKKYAIAR